MGSEIRVFEIAKEYDISSDKVISVLNEQGIAVKSKISVIDEKSVAKVIQIFEKRVKNIDGERSTETTNAFSQKSFTTEPPKNFQETNSKATILDQENTAEDDLPKIRLISKLSSEKSSPIEDKSTETENCSNQCAKTESLTKKSAVKTDVESNLSESQPTGNVEVKFHPLSLNLKGTISQNAKNEEIPQISLANIRPTGELSGNNSTETNKEEKERSVKNLVGKENPNFSLERFPKLPETCPTSSVVDNPRTDREDSPKNSSSPAASQPNQFHSLDEVYQAVVDQKRQEKIREEFNEERVVTIKVDQVVSKLSRFYEKLRNTLDYQDQYLMFRNAIYRILARLFREQKDRVFYPGLTNKKKKESANGKGKEDSLSMDASERDSTIQVLQPEELSRTLIIQLIRAGYLGNQQVLESKIKEIAAVIERFLSLEHFIKIETSFSDPQEGTRLREWLIHLAATNISENIERDDRNYLTISSCGTTSWSVKTSDTITKHLTNLVGNHIHENEDEDNEKYKRDRALQIYVSIHRKLFHYNRQMVEFSIFRYFYPDWDEINTEQEIIEIAKEYSTIRCTIERQADHPFYRKIQKITSRYAICFSILRDAFHEDPATTLSRIKKRPIEFQKSIESLCERRYLESQKDLFTNALKCVLYVILTKIGLVMLLELPLTNLFSPNMPTNLKHFTVAINITFPPLLLGLIALFTTIPHRQNTASIYSGLAEILYGKKSDIQLIKLTYPKNEKRPFNLFLASFLVLTTVTFSAIAAALFYIGFNWISIGIFLFFLAIINFLGFNLQKIAKRYEVCEPKGTVFSFIANQFYIPVIAMGKWLSDLFSENNILILILDKTVEGPFAKFVDTVEGWANYLRTKKEDSLEH